MNQPKNAWLLATLCLVTALCLIAAVAALQMWADDSVAGDSLGEAIAREAVMPSPTPRDP